VKYISRRCTVAIWKRHQSHWIEIQHCTIVSYDRVTWPTAPGVCFCTPHHVTQQWTY
jgi:hypothetical protein